VHLFDLAWVLWKIGLILATVNDIFVVGPSDFLEREEFVVRLLLLSLNLLLESGSDVSKALLADTVLAPQPLPRGRAGALMIAHLATARCVHSYSNCTRFKTILY